MVWFQDDWSGSAHSFTWKIRVWWNAEIKSFLVLKFCASQSRHLLTITLAMQCCFFSNCRAIILGNQHYVCRVCISPDPFHVNNMRHILIQFSASWWSLDNFIYLYECQLKTWDVFRIYIHKTWVQCYDIYSNVKYMFYVQFQLSGCFQLSKYRNLFSQNVLCNIASIHLGNYGMFLFKNAVFYWPYISTWWYQCIWVRLNRNHHLKHVCWLLYSLPFKIHMAALEDSQCKEHWVYCSGLLASCPLD